MDEKTGVLKTGVLLVNLGTPDAPTPWGVIKFLRAFLSDTRVVEMPKWIWRGILYGIILPLRSIKVAKHYQSIWTEAGSPLRANTHQLSLRLSQYLSKHSLLNKENIENIENKENIENIEFNNNEPLLVVNAMTYGNPSLKKGISILNNHGVSRLIVLPLFPFYSSTTTAAVLDAIFRLLARQRTIPSLFFVRDYGLEEYYIEAVAQSILEHWEQHGRSERLLFSFHGIPERNHQAGDIYALQCQASTKRIVEKLKIPENSWAIGFQSRFGFNAWLQPSTDSLLVEWAKAGVQSCDVISPSFAVECLETLQELCQQSRERFIQAGGKHFCYIPTLNVSDRHVELFGRLILKFL